MSIIIDNNQQIIHDIREIYYNTYSNQLRNVIAKHFIPSKDEKKNHAEIPTPVELVDDMLNKIPIDFWTSPHKVFEPCSGKGNFVIAIFDFFYNGLQNTIPDNIERSKFIITNCLYYADISPLNVFITTEILKCHIQSYCELQDIDFDFNNYIGDTLQLDIEKVWGLNGFDAVIGNPPYNSSGNTGTGNTIWQYFSKKSLDEWLKINGYLVLVHPSGWRKPESEKSKYKELFKLMTYQHQMVYLEIHNTKDGLKTFGCGTRYDWYVIEKKENYKETIIKDENGNISSLDLKKWVFLPNYNFNILENILTKNQEESIDIIYNSSLYETRKKWVNEKESNEYKYPLIHSTLKNNKTRYYYTNDNTRGFFGIKKVIFGDSGINNCIIDIEGKYGMTQHSMAIPFENLVESNNIKKALESDNFKDILNSCSWSNFMIDWRLFTYIKKDFWKEFI